MVKIEGPTFLPNHDHSGRRTVYFHSGSVIHCIYLRSGGFSFGDNIHRAAQLILIKFVQNNPSGYLTFPKRFGYIVKIHLGV
jgi:hypothetical protein